MTDFARIGADGVLVFRSARFRAAIGRGGIRGDKQEGDEATPVGALALRRVLYRADRVTRPLTVVPVEPLAPSDGWCDDPAHGDYNRPVTLPHSGRAEELWRREAVYDVIGVLGWNDAPVVRGRGSAIFLHVARPDYAPTAGCVALALADLLEVLGAGCARIDVVMD